MKKTLVLCDREQAYVQKLMEYFSRKSVMSFRIVSFSDEEYLCDFARDNHIDIMIISENMLNEKTMMIRTKRTLVMTESSERSNNDNGRIYKYQPAGNILKEAMSLYEAEIEAIGGNKRWHDRKKIIGLCSPAGGTRKTSFALTLGILLSRQRHVLYMNTEAYSGLEMMTGMNFEYDLSDLLYFTSQKDVSLASKLNNMIVTIQNLDMLPTARYPEDIRQTDNAVWIELLNRIMSESIYDILLLDMGMQMEDTESIIKFCDRVFVPYRNDILSESRIHDFEESISDEERKKIRKIILPFYRASGTGGEYYDNLIWSELGDFAKNIIKEEF